MKSKYISPDLEIIKFDFNESILALTESVIESTAPTLDKDGDDEW